MISASFTLSLPPTTNHIWRHTGRRVYMTAQAKLWKQEAQWVFKTKWKTDILQEPVRVIANFYLKRDRDVDNLKLLLDSLQDIVVVDDSQVVELHVMKHRDPDPRVEVRVETLV